MSRLLVTFLLALLSIACDSKTMNFSTTAPSGRQLYEHHGCALCHGPKGIGDGPVSASLNPPPPDLRNPRIYRVGSTEAIIATTIEQGILVFGGSGMTPFAHIPAEERLELARYIVSLQEPVHEPDSKPGSEPEPADES